MIGKTTQRKLTVILLSTIVFSIFGALMGEPLGIPYMGAMICATILGLSVGIFEEFYIQSHHAVWLRSQHPIINILISSLIMTLFCLSAIFVTIIIRGKLEHLAAILTILPKLTGSLLLLCGAGTLTLRVFGFIGPKNVFYLVTGRYHRPVEEKKVFAFIDLKGSTNLVESLGPTKARELVCKFLIDVSRPITDHGGEIHRYSGDGMIAVWDWSTAFQNNNVLNGIKQAHTALTTCADSYLKEFGHIPEFRTGIHGGVIITSEQGDIRRSIDYHGTNINLAARLEQMGKHLDSDTLMSATIVENLEIPDPQIHLIGPKEIRGFNEPVQIHSLLLN